MTTPRVTIGLPVYNGERYLRESIDSVLGQTFGDLELLVADNASTDGTLDLVHDYARADSRVRVLHSDRNQGAAWNYNRLVGEAHGELFRWHAHDDSLLPTAIERCVAALDADPGAVLAHTWTRFVDDDGAPVRDFVDDLHVEAPSPARRLRATIEHLSYCNVVFGVVRRDVLARTALIAPFVGSDVALIYELSLHGRFAVVPEFLFVRRPGNSVRSNPTRAALEAWFRTGAGRRPPPAIDHARSGLAAIHRAGLGPLEEARVLATFGTVWPPAYARRARRRRRARQARTSPAATLLSA